MINHVGDIIYKGNAEEELQANFYAGGHQHLFNTAYQFDFSKKLHLKNYLVVLRHTAMAYFAFCFMLNKIT